MECACSVQHFDPTAMCLNRLRGALNLCVLHFNCSYSGGKRVNYPGPQGIIGLWEILRNKQLLCLAYGAECVTTASPAIQMPPLIDSLLTYKGGYLAYRV